MNQELFRVHYARAVVSTASLRDVDQGSMALRKPNGLWWAFGTDWHDHATNKKPKGAYVEGPSYAVKILDGAKLLVLDSAAEIAAFTEKFGRRLSYATPTSPADRCVDWAAVSEEYDGIEIRALRKDERKRLEWLDIDWDVASGCAWRPAAVLQLTPIEHALILQKAKGQQAGKKRSGPR